MWFCQFSLYLRNRHHHVLIGFCWESYMKTSNRTFILQSSRGEQPDWHWIQIDFKSAIRSVVRKRMMPFIEYTSHRITTCRIRLVILLLQLTIRVWKIISFTSSSLHWTTWTAISSSFVNIHSIEIRVLRACLLQFLLSWVRTKSPTSARHGDGLEYIRIWATPLKS